MVLSVGGIGCILSLPADVAGHRRVGRRLGGFLVRFSRLDGAAEPLDQGPVLGDVVRRHADRLAAQAVARLAQLVVPALGDWCIVTLVEEGAPHGTTRRGARDVGWWHRDPEARPLLDSYAGARMSALRDDSFLLRCLATGQRMVREAGATAAVQGVLYPGRAHELIGRLAPESFIILPLRGRDRTVGLLTLFNGPDRAPMSPEDLITVGEVAARAGLALDNARLYRQQRLLAEELQRSLLTAPPEPDHAEIVVRYLPAVEAAAVGGDWYDAFMQADGATTLVIGDVAGHDIAAAATMGQLRGLLRGIATSENTGPADVLSRLDGSMALLDLKALVTATIARFEQTMDERLRGVTRMRWSNAGHLPLLVIHPDGNLGELGRWQGDLLLGVDPTAVRQESVVDLAAGTTVLLFTDGLIERRSSDLDAGMAALRDAALELADRPLDELCDEIIERLVSGRPEDDVALVAELLGGILGVAAVGPDDSLFDLGGTSLVAVRITDRLSVSTQPSLGEIGSLPKAGFTTLINNRPDGEAPGQP